MGVGIIHGIRVSRAESSILAFGEMRWSMEHPWLKWWSIRPSLSLWCETLSASVSRVFEFNIFRTRRKLR
jgi:hypothetical protein